MALRSAWAFVIEGGAGVCIAVPAPDTDAVLPTEVDAADAGAPEAAAAAGPAGAPEAEPPPADAGAALREAEPDAPAGALPFFAGLPAQPATKNPIEMAIQTEAAATRPLARGGLMIRRVAFSRAPSANGGSKPGTWKFRR